MYWHPGPKLASGGMQTALHMAQKASVRNIVRQQLSQTSPRTLGSIHDDGGTVLSVRSSISSTLDNGAGVSRFRLGVFRPPIHMLVTILHFSRGREA